MRKKLFSIAALTVLLTGLMVPGLSLAKTSSSSSITPKLQVDLPFVKLTEPERVGEGAGYYFIPWLGQYMTGIYQTGVAIASILSAIMLIMGGIGWASAGGSSEKVSKAQTKIKNALVGLMLSLGAYTILYVINPSLTQFKSLKIRVVKPEAIEMETLDKDVFQKLAEIGLKSNPQLAGLVCDPTAKRKEDDETECYHGRVGTIPTVQMDPPQVVGDGKPEKEALLPYVYAAGKAWGIDPCIAYATIGAESEWIPGRLGHDENFRTAPWTIPARMTFLQRGEVKGGGYDPKTQKLLTIGNFTGPDQKAPGGSTIREFCNSNSSAAECVAFQAAQMSDLMQNQDNFINKPPDYGLDWDYSHGIGVGQSTIFRNSKCPDGQRGITYEDKRPDGFGTRCYTVPELFDVATSVDSLYREIAGIQFGSGSGNRAPDKVLAGFICNSCESQAEKRINTYNACRDNFQQMVCGITCTNRSCSAGASKSSCANYDQMMTEWKPPAKPKDKK